MIQNFPQGDRPATVSDRSDESHLSQTQSEALRSEAIHSLFRAPGSESTRVPQVVEHYDILRPILLEELKRMDEINKLFGRSGSMSQQEASDYFPQRYNSDYRANEPADTSAVLDTLAYMASPDKKDPYDTIRSGEQGYAIGRYGLTSDIIIAWLSAQPDYAEVLGNPADMGKLPELMAQLGRTGKIPGNFADEFRDPAFTQGFLQCLETMKEGHGELSSSQLEKYLPKAMQEAVIEGIAQSAVENGSDASSLALAMQLGKPLSSLSKTELDNPENQEYMYAALKVFGLALAKQEAGPDDRINWQKSGEHHFESAKSKELSQRSQKIAADNDDRPSSDLAFSIARAAENNARHTGTIGWCLRGVARTLDRFGIHLYGGSAYQAAAQLAENKHFKEVTADHLKKGTVLVFGRSNAHPHGHITVYLGNGLEASDHVQGLVKFRKYSSVRAFEPTL